MAIANETDAEYVRLCMMGDVFNSIRDAFGMIMIVP